MDGGICVLWGLSVTWNYAATNCLSGGVIFPVRTGLPMGTKCVIRLAARNPHWELAMAASST
eukprot:5158194-Pyramimonas_sp.AAC.1